MNALPLHYVPVVIFILCVLVLLPLISFYRRHRDWLFGGNRMRGDIILVGYLCTTILSFAFGVKALLGG